jgi:hypothetical protein
MVGFAFAAVSIDTSAAEAALNRVDGERTMVQGAVNAMISAFEGRKNFTKSMGKKLRTEMDVLFQNIYAEMNKTRGDVQKLETQAKASTRSIMSHVYHMVGQVWNILETTLGLGKTIAGHTISLAVSAIASVISMGYAAAATMSTMGPAGAVMAALQIASTMASVTAQANAIASQDAIERNKDNIGEDMFK